MTDIKKKKDYVIAIPSYKRQETLKKKTLNFLKKSKIDPKKIYIFVANTEEKKLYENVLDSKSYGKIIVGVPGLQPIRNFMSEYFGKNAKVFYMDDDVSKMYLCFEEKENRKLIEFKEKDLDYYIRFGFNLCELCGLRLFGFYPIKNAFFMQPISSKKAVSFDLKFIPGCAYGVIIDPECDQIQVIEKDDYERSIRYFIKYGGIVRMNFICFATKYYTEPGGMQANIRTLETNNISTNQLVELYPEYIAISNKKKARKDKTTNEPYLEPRLIKQQPHFKVPTNLEKFIKKNIF